MKFSRAAVAVLLAGASLAGCQTAQRALGQGKVAPDEFRVVTKAPLVVPPDYSLRPPAPGAARPEELRPESAARVAALNEAQAQARSTGETLLVQKAGGAQADPLARYVIDDEFGDIAHKDKSFADRVMFWRRDNSAPDPAEQQRVAEVTGSQQVVIAPNRRSTRLKLPGL
ncbi:MAG TPA: DUF3035 domain-containing protein [Caulobacteraceae bacterium]